MKLYEFSVSRSIRAHWMLKEVGANFETITVDLPKGGGQDPEFLKIHPLGKVPALVDGNFSIWESSAIINYLAEKFPEKNLIPKSGTYEKGEYDQWMAYTTTELDSILWTRAKHNFIYPEELRVPDVKRACEWEFKKNIIPAEEILGERKYILGDQFSGVDVILGHTLMWANGLEGYLADCPNCVDYIKRVKERENFPREMYKD